MQQGHSSEEEEEVPVPHIHVEDDDIKPSVGTGHVTLPSSIVMNIRVSGVNSYFCTQKDNGKSNTIVICVNRISSNLVFLQIFNKILQE